MDADQEICEKDGKQNSAEQSDSQGNQAPHLSILRSKLCSRNVADRQPATYLGAADDCHDPCRQEAKDRHQNRKHHVIANVNCVSGKRWQKIACSRFLSRRQMSPASGAICRIFGVARQALRTENHLDLSLLIVSVGEGVFWGINGQ